MTLLRLAEHAVFDVADGDGIILDTFEGEYFSLNPMATLILQAALRYATTDEVIDHLKGRIDATDSVLRAALNELTAQLDEQHLVASQKAKSP
jgi:hypothetical protein